MDLATARDSLHSKLTASTGEEILISPVSGSPPVVVGAVRGQSGTETHETAMPGYTLTAIYVDWIYDVDALQVDYVPQVDDKIQDESGREYRVINHPSDNRPWRWSGSHGRKVRVHSMPEEQV